jgi:DNA-binding transcriptional LysR family regulator
MHFTLKQLQYFVVTCETGSIKHAAIRTHISESAISIAISQLEAELGLPLLVRHHARGIALTAEGDRFLSEAKILLKAADRLKSVSLKISSKTATSVTVGCLSTQYHFIVPEISTRISKRFENSCFKCIAGDQPSLIDKLRAGDISIALVWRVGIPSECSYRPITRLPPYVILPVDHPLADRETLNLQELANDPFLLLDCPLSRDYFLSLFENAGVEPRITGPYQQMEVIRNLVAQGSGYGVTTAPPIGRVTSEGKLLSYIKIEGADMELGVGVASRGPLEGIQMGEEFFDVCQERILGRYNQGYQSSLRTTLMQGTTGGTSYFER